MGADSKSEKRQSSHRRLFVLLGFACAKAALKMLVKLTPRGRGKGRAEKERK